MGRDRTEKSGTERISRLTLLVSGFHTISSRINKDFFKFIYIIYRLKKSKYDNLSVLIKFTLFFMSLVYIALLRSAT